MAFETPTTAPARAPSNATSSVGTREPKTTLAYISLYIPLADGTRVKLVSDLTLRMFKERDVESKVIEAIRSGAKSLEDLQNLIQVEVSLARDPDSPTDVAW